MNDQISICCKALEKLPLKFSINLDTYCVTGLGSVEITIQNKVFIFSKEEIFNILNHLKEEDDS